MAAVLVAGSLLAAAYIVRILERALVEPERISVGPDPRGRALAAPALALAVVPVLLGFLAHLPLSLLEIGSPVGALP